MHDCWIFLCMSLIIFFYASLYLKKGIDKRNNSKGGLAGSTPRLVGGWGCYIDHY
jgi:hypothetical protein